MQPFRITPSRATGKHIWPPMNADRTRLTVFGARPELQEPSTLILIGVHRRSSAANNVLI